LSYGLEEKKGVLFLGRNIQIVRIEGYDIIRESPLKEREIN